MLDRVKKPAKKKRKKSSAKGSKGSGGFGFSEGGAAAEAENVSATPKNVMAPELENLENMMRNEDRRRAAGGTYKCRRCEQESKRAGKCCGEAREKIS